MNVLTIQDRQNYPRAVVLTICALQQLRQMQRSVADVFGRWPARPLTAEELARREARLEREGLRVRRQREGDAI